LFVHSRRLAGDSLDELFDDLIECYSSIGFTDSCSALWAHWGTTNEALCSSTCLKEAQALFGMDSVGAEEISMIPSNGAPPLCSLSECQSCSFNMFEEDFDALAGIWKSPRNAGMLDNIVHDCQSFYPIENHDPCQGTIGPRVEMLTLTDEIDSTMNAPFPTTEPTTKPNRLRGVDLTEIAAPLVLTTDDSTSAPSPRPTSLLSVHPPFRTIDSPAVRNQQTTPISAPPLVLTVDLASEPSPMPSSRLGVGSAFRTIGIPSIGLAEIHDQQSNTPAPTPPTPPLVLTIDFPVTSPAEVHQQQSNTPAPTPPLVLTIDFPTEESPDEEHQQESNVPTPTPPVVLTIDFPIRAAGAAASASGSSENVALSADSALQNREFSIGSMVTFHFLLVIGTIANVLLLV
jgi:hypothetical protein